MCTILCSIILDLVKKHFSQSTHLNGLSPKITPPKKEKGIEIASFKGKEKTLIFNNIFYLNVLTYDSLNVIVF